MKEIKSTFVQLPPREPWAPPAPGMLYEPVEPDENSRICVLVMHSDEDYLAFMTGPELAKRGFRVLCTNVMSKEGVIYSQINKMSSVRGAIEFLRKQPEIEKIVLMGHSGGATLMTAYQNIAENGVEVFKGPEKLVPYPSDEEYPPADGIMLLDANWGNAAMQLFSLDPAVTDETSGMKLDSELNLFDPEKGFDPAGSTFSQEFIRKYQKAQSARNNRLIDRALERLELIEKGEGLYSDDEPLVIPGSAQSFMNNKLYAQDTRLMAHTKEPHLLLHPDGTETVEIVPSIRVAENPKSLTHSLWEGGRVLSVKSFLTSYAVRTEEDFGYDESGVWGIDWSSSYCCPPGNVVGIKAPLLVMGMTGGWEFLASETIYNQATTEDKTIAFVEGATHKFNPAKHCEKTPGQFGDTVKTIHDYVAKWLTQEGRF